VKVGALLGVALLALPRLRRQILAGNELVAVFTGERGLARRVEGVLGGLENPVLRVESAAGVLVLGLRSAVVL